MGKKRAAKAPQKVDEKVEQEQWESESEEQFDHKNAEKNQKEEKFSLYKLLDLPEGPKSTFEQIKKQYRLLAMTHHPDKNIGDETAREKFQKLKEAYDVLSDPQKKKVYDETGIIGDDMDERAFETAYEYYRSISKKIQVQDIEDFEKKYRGGEEEKEDLLQFYNNYGGNMTLLLQNIPCSKNEDIPRFIQFYEQQIEQKVIKKEKIFEKTKNKVRLLPDESKEVELMEKEMAEENKLKDKGMNDLVLAIRNKSKVPFWEALEEKYAEKPKKTKAEKKKPTNPQKPSRRVNKK